VVKDGRASGTAQGCIASITVPMRRAEECQGGGGSRLA